MASAASIPRADGNQRFNAEAEEWDSNPFVHAMSQEAWKAIQRSVLGCEGGDAAAKKLDVLEIGCGTGLLSFEMAPSVNRLVAVDAADGMIAVLEKKLERPGAPTNIQPVAVLLEDPEDASLPPADAADPAGPRLKFDLITSHLVLHHIPDLKPVLKTMLGCLKQGGMVALTDFEDFGPEARLFHPEHKMEGVERHGIPRGWMAQLMEEVGFADVKVEVAWKHTKMVETFKGEFDPGASSKGQGKPMDFSYLLCMGKRP